VLEPCLFVVEAWAPVIPRSLKLLSTGPAAPRGLRSPVAGPTAWAGLNPLLNRCLQLRSHPCDLPALPSSAFWTYTTPALFQTTSSPFWTTPRCDSWTSSLKRWRRAEAPGTPNPTATGTGSENWRWLLIMDCFFLLFLLCGSVAVEAALVLWHTFLFQRGTSHNALKFKRKDSSPWWSVWAFTFWFSLPSGEVVAKVGPWAFDFFNDLRQACAAEWLPGAPSLHFLSCSLLWRWQCCVFTGSPGRVLPATSRCSSRPRGAVFRSASRLSLSASERGSVVGDLMGFHSLLPPRINRGWFLTNPVVARGWSLQGFNSSLAFLPPNASLGWWVSRASKPVFTSFLLLKTSLTIFWNCVFSVTRIPRFKGASRHAAPRLQSKFPFTFSEVPVLHRSVFLSDSFSQHLTSVRQNNPAGDLELFGCAGRQLPPLPGFS